jgi:hypothetical protein
MSLGNCVTRAERQIRDLGGETRDYDPHGAISTPSHLNRSFLRFRQADSSLLGLTGVKRGILSSV